LWLVNYQLVFRNHQIACFYFLFATLMIPKGTALRQQKV